MATPTKRILVATDLSEGSDEALAHAIELGRQTGAVLELVHVLEFGDAQHFPFGLANYVGDTAGVVAHIDRELAARADRASAAGLRCYTRTLDGTAHQEIVKEAREAKADLIVIGTHGRRGLAHAFLGSVAEHVVRHAGCPVLTVPFSKKVS